MPASKLSEADWHAGGMKPLAGTVDLASASSEKHVSMREALPIRGAHGGKVG